MSSSQAHSWFVRVFEGMRECDSLAYSHCQGDLTFSQLYAEASKVATYLRRVSEVGDTIAVYGHKNRKVLIAYWACIITGRTVMPIEPDIPSTRLERIVSMCDCRLMIDATSGGLEPRIAGVELIDIEVCNSSPVDIPPAELAVGDEVVQYIMMSSGSTGAPKGIKITYANVFDFATWISSFVGDAVSAITGNVRFCFDVSLVELWISWVRRVPVCALDHSEVFNTRKHIANCRSHGVSMWVSTPTLIRFFLADPSFCGQHLDKVTTFFLAGEVLAKKLVEELWRRFPSAVVFNGYGPTECTVVVTVARITRDDIRGGDQLPIGYARPRTELRLGPPFHADGRGEIVIEGKAVGAGYITTEGELAARFHGPLYRTGDFGRRREDGLWYFCGRTDREYKIRGYRVNLHEIEEELRNVGMVDEAQVRLRYRGQYPDAMEAHIAGLSNASDLKIVASTLAMRLPPYSVPRYWYLSSGVDVNFNTKWHLGFEGTQRPPDYIFTPKRVCS